MIKLLLLGLIVLAIALVALKLPESVYNRWEALVHGLLFFSLFSIWLVWLSFLCQQVLALVLIFQ